MCSGTPTGTVAAFPNSNCVTYTTTLSVSGAVGCGITYQWQWANAVGGPYTNFGTSTPTQTYAITATKYFRCIETCTISGLSYTTNVVAASITPSICVCDLIQIPSLPYSSGAATTCGMGNDITSSNVTNVCGNSSYYGGEDAVYSFTPTATGVINFTLSSSGSYTGLMLYQGCPTSGGTCVNASQTSTGDKTLTCVNVTAGQVYYLVIDSWPSPTCNPYSLSISSVNTGVICTCGLIQIPSLPYSSGAQTTCGAGDDITSSNVTNVCGNSIYYTGEDAVYSFTPTATGVINFTLSSSGSYTGLMLYKGCPTSGGTCVNASQSSTGDKTLTCVNVTAGQVYYLVIDSYAAPSCNPYSLSISSVNTGVICTCGLIQIPSLPYSSGAQTTCGAGDDITSTNATNVCGSSNYYTGEDAVYSFTPTTTGQLTVSIASTGSSTGLMLYQGCPTSGGTCVGFAQSSSGNQTLACVGVTAGQVYYLVIDSYAAPSCNPYNLSITSVVPSGTVCNMNYTPSSITYSFETFTGTSLPMTDDVLFSTIVMFGFSTCWDGGTYWGGYPASNAAFVFDAICNVPNIQSSTIAGPGVSTGYTITGPAPIFGTSVPRNAVLGPWHDINPASSATVAASKIQYTTLGTAPNRRTIISYENIPMYSAACETVTAQRFSGQIKIFENGNIEIHIKNKQVCSTWNGGYAVMGLHNYNGTVYIPPVNAVAHNYPTQWTMTNTAYRFTYNCGAACSVLPIGFSAFYGERISKVNHLYWETSEEINIKTMIVERSKDGINFEKIGETTPNNKPSKYQFNDVTAPIGIISYYRITSQEFNGSVKRTSIYALDAAQDEIFVTSLYPNPFTNEINLSVESRVIGNKQGTANVKIYDVTNKLVLTKEINLQGGGNTYKIDGSALPGGMYIVEIILNDKDRVIEKIIKN